MKIKYLLLTVIVFAGPVTFVPVVEAHVVRPPTSCSGSATFKQHFFDEDYCSGPNTATLEIGEDNRATLKTEGSSFIIPIGGGCQEHTFSGWNATGTFYTETSRVAFERLDDSFDCMGDAEITAQTCNIDVTCEDFSFIGALNNDCY